MVEHMHVVYTDRGLNLLFKSCLPVEGNRVAVPFKALEPETVRKLAFSVEIINDTTFYFSQHRFHLMIYKYHYRSYRNGVYIHNAIHYFGNAPNCILNTTNQFVSVFLSLCR